MDRRAFLKSAVAALAGSACPGLGAASLRPDTLDDVRGCLATMKKLGRT